MFARIMVCVDGRDGGREAPRFGAKVVGCTHGAELGDFATGVVLAAG